MSPSTVSTVDDAIDADWIPSYYDGDDECLTPVCPACQLVPQAVLSALGLREEPQRPLTETLIDSLRPKRALLILDNCEHLGEACAELAEREALLGKAREALEPFGGKP